MGYLKCNGYLCKSGLNVNMVKISISLPNNAQITFESEESEVLREIVAFALRDLPRDLMQTSRLGIESVSTEEGKSDASSALSNTPSSELSPQQTRPKTEPESEPAVAAAPLESINSQTVSKSSIPTEFLSENGRMAFEAFCKDVNPLGDMRRVVVATEGAMRHFGVNGVNADDLVWLFETAGWRMPGNFTQTLRNAARSKFGWLERIPGRSGHYATTPLGVSKTIPIV